MMAISQLLDNDHKYLILCSPMAHTVNGADLERFDDDGQPSPAETVTEEVTIELDRRTTVVPYRARNTVLQTARLAGLHAPSSCEIGSCGTCIARVVEGSVRMANNDVLDDEEVADGWVLTCQSMPTSRTVRVVYE